jgi:hypothetical protein
VAKRVPRPQQSDPLVPPPFLVQHIDLLELSRGPATFQKTLPVPFVFLTGYGRTSMSFTTF